MLGLLCYYWTPTYTRGWSGSWLYSPSVGLLSWVLLAGSLLILLCGAAALAAHFIKPSSDRDSTKSKSSKIYGMASRFLTSLQTWMTRNDREERLMRERIAHLKELTKPPEPKGYARLLGVTTTALVVFWTVTGWVAIAEHRQIVVLQQEIYRIKSEDAQRKQLPANTVIMHGIIVTARVPHEDKFRAWVPNPATREWEEVAFTVCPRPTFRLSDEIQPGVTLTLWQYQEDHANSCADLSNERFAGYIIWRDNANKPILTSISRPSTTSTIATATP